MDDAGNNKKIVNLLIASVFNQHDFSMLDEFMCDDYIQHNPDVPQGKAGFKEFFAGTFRAMPDFSYWIKQIIAEGDLVMVYSTTSGTHTGGEWLGKPAAGNKLNFDVVDIFRIQDGKIAEHWDVADTFSLFKQLGIIERLMAE